VVAMVIFLVFCWHLSCTFNWHDTLCFWNMITLKWTLPCYLHGSLLVKNAYPVTIFMLAQRTWQQPDLVATRGRVPGLDVAVSAVSFDSQHTNEGTHFIDLSNICHQVKSSSLIEIIIQSFHMLQKRMLQARLHLYHIVANVVRYLSTNMLWTINDAHSLVSCRRMILCCDFGCAVCKLSFVKVYFRFIYKFSFIWEILVCYFRTSFINVFMCLCIVMHACIHAYKDTYMHAYLHTLHTYIHTYIHTYMSLWVEMHQALLTPSWIS
jgi:hypothetical protein